MLQRDETIAEIWRLDALREYAVMHGDEGEAERLRAALRKLTDKVYRGKTGRRGTWNCKNQKTCCDAEAAARDPPSPRLRWIKGGVEAAGEEGRGAITAFT